MSATALRGCINRAGTGETPRGQGHPKSTSQAEIAASEIEWLQSVGFRRRRAHQVYRFFLAQAAADTDFHEWVITYADPTGESATNNVLWHHAREVTQ